MSIETIKIKRGLLINLPLLRDGELAFTEDTQQLWIGTSVTGNIIIGGQGIRLIGALDGNGAGDNGATIANGLLYMQSASGTEPGLVNTNAQTFAGQKTFTSTIVGSISGNAATATTATSAVTVTGSFSGDVTGTQAAMAIAAATVTGKALTGYSSTTGTVSATDTILSAIGKMNGNIAAKVATSSVGAASGVASLDGSGKVPTTQLPSSVMEFQGNWNPSTNTPALSDASGTAGNVYWVSAAFSSTISGLANPSMTNFQIGDLVIYSAASSQWELSTPAAGVRSVNGAQGAVSITTITGNAGTASAPASGSAHGAVTLDGSGNFESVAPGVAGGYLRSNGTDFVRSTIQASDVPTLNQNTTGSAASATTATTATAPATGSAHGAVALDSSGNFKSVAPGSSGNVLQSNGTDWVSAAPGAATYTAPTVQKFTSSSGTYNRPAGVLYIRVRMVGGGGGGSGSGTSAGVGGTGGNTTFGTTLLAANGGTGATAGSTGGAGGTASLGTGPVGIAIAGATGNAYNHSVSGTFVTGMTGASSPFAGGGAGGAPAAAGVAAPTNSGAGGGGAGSASADNGGSSGGAGGFVDAIITSPAASYAYAVGSAGTAGTAGTGGSAGGAGGSGLIEVTEYYQ